MSGFDAARIRADFPILDQQVHGHPLVYLDNAATSQKPQAVIDATRHYYAAENSNVHRGVHALSERATVAYENAREAARAFINAASTRECVFVRGTTEAINLVAQSYARPRLQPGDEVLISHLEHHSNIVPWQMVCEQTGATLKVIPVNDNAELDQAAFVDLLSENTKILAIGHVSNAFGTVNPITAMIEQAHAVGAVVLVDGAQATPHERVDVQALDVDFYAFSGHKVYGPTGIGVLYGRESLLDAMPPYHGGGEMIRAVYLDRYETNTLPHKFEAGTPNIAGAAGLTAALNYVSEVGIDNIAAWEHELLAYATEQVAQIDQLRLIGTAAHKAGILSFIIDDIHAHDLGTILDRDGVAIRAGHHCAMPAMQRFGVAATARASFAMYNTKADVDALIAALQRARALFD